MKLPALPDFITEGAAQASAFVNKPITGKLPETSTATKACIGAAALILGTGVCIGLTKPENKSLWGRFAAKVKSAVKSTQEFVENNPTIVKAVAIAATVGIGAAVLYKITPDPTPANPRQEVDLEPITPRQEQFYRNLLQKKLGGQADSAQ